MLRLGFACSLSRVLGSSWDQTTHISKTLYGTSSINYTSAVDTTLLDLVKDPQLAATGWLFFLPSLTPWTHPFPILYKYWYVLYLEWLYREAAIADNYSLGMMSTYSGILSYHHRGVYLLLSIQLCSSFNPLLSTGKGSLLSTSGVINIIKKLLVHPNRALEHGLTSADQPST